MLLQFNFKNFKSFKDDTTLDMTATKSKEYESHVIERGYERILPVAAIFGANASGKTNILEAFKFMQKYVLYSFGYGGENKRRGKTSLYSQLTPFLFDTDSSTSPSSFEVYFIIPEDSKEKTYNYGFTLDKNGVCEEWLNCKSKSSENARRIFYRNHDDNDLSGIDKDNAGKNIMAALENETLILSLGAKLKIKQLKMIYNWFYNNEVVDFGKPLENFILSENLPKNFIDSKTVQEKVLDYFASFDPSIVGFNVEKIPNENEDGAVRAKVGAVHKMINGKETVSIPLKMESAGTLKMLALFPALQEVLDKGGVLVVDELNSRLHPLLARNFVITFTNPNTNPNHAQLIFATHDVWQLNSNLLRRDEVWFADKNEQGVSSLYSLADFIDEDGDKIRKDENHEKNYLLGKYGAIPNMRTIKFLEED